MPRTFHALKVPKPRQDWSKYNLYNLQRIRSPRLENKTFFQQKWAAKNLGRSYHNPYVREGQWSRMFDRRLPAVVPLDFRYLAENDGSEQATGRGMGVQAVEDKRRLQRDGQRATKTNKTPYMSMAFHPLERRLDTAIFRALFASSTKQARQMVVHGWVKVNGKKMTYPGYMLNPGDMFSVDPERVLYATGAPKPRQQVSGGAKKAAAAEGEEASEEASEEPQEEASSEETEVKASKKDAAESESTAQDGPVAKTPEETKEILRRLMLRAKWITEGAKGNLSGRRLKDLRRLRTSIRHTMSNFGARKSVESTNVTLEELTNTLEDVVSKIPEQHLPASEASKSSESDAQTPGTQKEAEHSPSKDAQLLYKALQRAHENPVDHSKPYRTPWRPRDYMSAFAFIPRYLEVNQNICSAVYLRHPVARPGIAEVPTPVSGEISGLIFNWYLRRR